MMVGFMFRLWKSVSVVFHFWNFLLTTLSLFITLIDSKTLWLIRHGINIPILQWSSLIFPVILFFLFCDLGLAVGLDPQGYGNPDFCWLSVHDTLIWSFAGPIVIVVVVSIVEFASCADCSLLLSFYFCLITIYS